MNATTAVAVTVALVLALFLSLAATSHIRPSPADANPPQAPSVAPPVQDLDTRLAASEEVLATFRRLTVLLDEAERSAQSIDTQNWPNNLRVLFEELTSRRPASSETIKELSELLDTWRATAPPKEVLERIWQLTQRLQDQAKHAQELTDRFEAAFQQYSNVPYALVAVDLLNFLDTETTRLESQTKLVDQWLEDGEFLIVLEAQARVDREQLERARSRYHAQNARQQAALASLKQLGQLVASGVEGQLYSLRTHLRAYPQIVEDADQKRRVLVTGFAVLSQLHKPGDFFAWQMLIDYRDNEPLIPDLILPKTQAWQGAPQCQEFLSVLDSEIAEIERLARQKKNALRQQRLAELADAQARQQLFKRIADLEQQAATIAIVRYPSDAVRQAELEHTLRERYLDELARKSGKSRNALQQIANEGVRLGWEF